MILILCNNKKHLDFVLTSNSKSFVDIIVAIKKNV